MTKESQSLVDMFKNILEPENVEWRDRELLEQMAIGRALLHIDGIIRALQSQYDGIKTDEYDDCLIKWKAIVTDLCNEKK
jgi:hypothetical protein